ncbi:3-hydroxyacyl-CoA dehydrogenase family protein [Amycolatopsis sp. OK19-0408]|uniref:3-hydroxyacyl-CoA dehydrogenase family protein n=2 Tax=Amycolatopsis iheyensis TaxID=2945988 RepID=A0A9X2NKV1_9PSEU|nr:3-hydroxyacyl-CoA dehydrogenase family protein [Amycolatopsis iheyensis]
MGIGIATLGVSRGLDVVLVDVDPAKAASAPGRVARELRLATLTGALDRDAPLGAVRATTSVDDAVFDDGVPADAVVEAVVENAAVKTRVLAALSHAVGPHVPIVTNTSSIPVDELAAGVPHPETVLGIHFMNPAYLVPTVEVVPGSRTSDAIRAGASALLARLGRTGVEVGDGPGFVTSRVSHRMINDAIKIVEEGRASAADVDLLMQNCLGHPLGPLRTADLIGLDNLADSLAVLFDRTGDDTFRPAGLLLAKVAAGDHGRKSGRGFYPY